MFNKAKLTDHLNRQVAVKNGYLTFRLYQDGWLVRFTPFKGQPIKIESADIETACQFANSMVG